MDSQILCLALAGLAFALALNLKLTFSVLHTVRRERVAPEALETGTQLPPVAARALGGGRRMPLLPQGQACALLFLASRCPKCRSTLPGLAELLPDARAAGLAVRIVSDESRWRLRSFLADPVLEAAVARVSARDYRAINPPLSSPAYLFVDHEGTVEAVGLIGDANWCALLEQLAGDVPAASAAA